MRHQKVGAVGRSSSLACAARLGNCAAKRLGATLATVFVGALALDIVSVASLSKSMSRLDSSARGLPLTNCCSKGATPSAYLAGSSSRSLSMCTGLPTICSNRLFDGRDDSCGVFLSISASSNIVGNAGGASGVNGFKPCWVEKVGQLSFGLLQPYIVIFFLYPLRVLQHVLGEYGAYKDWRGDGFSALGQRYIVKYDLVLV